MRCPEPSRARCEAQIGDPDACLFVAEVAGKVIGYGRAGRMRSCDDAPADTIPAGWYLLGLVVVDAWRRHGIGRALTERRLAWIAERAGSAWYFVNARNRPSLDLHHACGFVEVTRRFVAPGISFTGGEGVLCRIDLSAWSGAKHSAGSNLE